MTSQIAKISGNCRKIKLQNFSILRYYSSICATHTSLSVRYSVIADDRDGHLGSMYSFLTCATNHMDCVLG